MKVRHMRWNLHRSRFQSWVGVNVKVRGGGDLHRPADRQTRYTGHYSSSCHSGMEDLSRFHWKPGVGHLAALLVVQLFDWLVRGFWEALNKGLWEVTDRKWLHVLHVLAQVIRCCCTEGSQRPSLDCSSVSPLIMIWADVNRAPCPSKECLSLETKLWCKRFFLCWFSIDVCFHT